jgi:hypothetical protein
MSVIEPPIISDASDEDDVLGVRLVIELACTSDDSAGPWPPPGDAWHLVRCADGVTVWRRISLSE